MIAEHVLDVQFNYSLITTDAAWQCNAERNHRADHLGSTAGSSAS